MTINLPQLLEELNSDDIETYLAAQDQIRANQKTVLPSLIDLMLTQTNRRAWRAAALAASMKEASTVPAFIEALDSPNALIRQTAAQVLGDLGDETVVPHLIVRLNDKSLSVQIWLVESLGKLRDQRAVEPLSTLIMEADSAELQHSIIKAFGKIGDLRAVPILPAFFDSPDHHVCKRAHEVYQQLTDHS